MATIYQRDGRVTNERGTFSNQTIVDAFRLGEASGNAITIIDSDHLKIRIWKTESIIEVFVDGA